MAQARATLNQDSISCTICLGLLKDPVTIPCGHSYCMSCIKDFWGDKRRISSCPQCRQTFIQRPVLMKNILLAKLVEQLKKNWLGAAPADLCDAGPEDVFRDVCSDAAERAETQKELHVNRQQIQQRIQDRERDVELLQLEVEDINVSADKTVEDSEEIFHQLVHLIHKRSSDVKQQVRSQQETEVRRVKELQEKLEQEITELKRKDAELEQLSHTEDHKQLLHNYPSVSALSGSPHSSSIRVRPRRHFEDVTAAVSELRDVLQDVLRDRGTNVSLRGTAVGGLLPEPEPKTRADFLKYSREITLDPNSASKYLLLFEGNRIETSMEKQVYPDHPDRFLYYDQVLSNESLTGRCYWEVERSGGIGVAVAYKNISRADTSDECMFGLNDKSWALSCKEGSFKFWHNNVKTPVSGPGSSRIGVYLDHRAGILCFYSVSETMTLLHRVQTTFTQPLHAGVLFYYSNRDSANFIKLK